MKRKIFAAMTALMVLAMSTTVFAAGSSTSASVASSSSSASVVTAASATAAPATAAFTMTNSTESTTTASGSVLTVAPADSATIAAMVSEAKQLSPAAYVLGTAEITGTLAAGGEVVSVSCSDVKAGDTVDTIVVLHMSATKGLEVLRPTSVSAGKVEVFLTDLSPISIVHVPAGTAVAYTSTATAADATVTATEATATSSPKTGEF